MRQGTGKDEAGDRRDIGRGEARDREGIGGRGETGMGRCKVERQGRGSVRQGLGEAWEARMKDGRG